MSHACVMAYGDQTYVVFFASYTKSWLKCASPVSKRITGSVSCLHHSHALKNIEGSAVVWTQGLSPHAHLDPSSRPARKMSGPSTTMSGSTLGSDVATTR